MPRIRTVLALVALTFGFGAAQAAEERRTPYWASISAGQALMRTGPGRNYPATWLYRRADLPVKVIETYPDWRKVQDPSGETGWMLQRLLSDTRTGIVTAQGSAAMREKPDAGARIVYQAQRGVVGRISKCASGWCLFDSGGRKGYIQSEQIWGVDSVENLD